LDAATFTASKTGTETSTPSIGSVTVELPALQIEVTPSAIVEVMAGESVTYEITVRDGAGATVAGASIAGENAVTGSSVSISPTNEVGRATLVFAVPASRAAGDYIVRLAASKSGYTASSEESRTVRVTPPRLSIAVEPSDTVVRFPSQAVTFTITVRDPSGAPVRDASIAVTDNQENASGTTGPTDANGRATWTSDVAAGRAPATYRVSFVASKTDFLDSHSVSRYVRVVHPKLVLTVTPTSRSTIRRGENVTFTITARDEAGQPVSGAGIGIADELRAGSFTAGPTDGQGRTTYQTTASQSRAFDDYDIRFWASKTAYVTSDTLTRVVRVSPPTGDLGVTLQNIGAVNAPATGSVVMLYTDPIRTIEDANPAVFQGVPAGRYLVEGYFDGTFVGRELWTSRQVDVLADMSQSATLLRNYPYAESVVFKNNATNVVIAEGATIAAGTVVRAEVTVRNNIPNDPRTVRVRVFLDRNRQSSYDFSTFSQSQTVNGSGATVTFSVTFTPTLTGSYSRAIGVYTMLNSEVLTDSWDWRAAFNR
jgi:protocatechuate 3,4-dioxygenase beta subunit